MALTKYSDFLSASKSTLITYCSVRGMSTSGNTKTELVAKAFTAMEMKFEMIMSSDEQQKKISDLYENTLLTHGFEDPKLVPEEEKIDDMTKWPYVDLGIVFKHILGPRMFNRDYIGKFKKEKAYKYFESGFVSKILHSVRDSGHVFLYTQVTRSMSVTMHTDVWIVFKDGDLVAAWCSCMQGADGSCNHVAATLYKIDHAHTNGLCDPACTDVLCQWNSASKQDIQPSRINDIIIKKKG